MGSHSFGFEKRRVWLTQRAGKSRQGRLSGPLLPTSPPPDSPILGLSALWLSATTRRDSTQRWDLSWAFNSRSISTIAGLLKSVADYRRDSFLGMMPLCRRASAHPARREGIVKGTLAPPMFLRFDSK